MKIQITSIVKFFFGESAMVKMEIDLTEDQYDKVKDLEMHGVSFGEAIDLLFKVKFEVLAQIDTIDNNIQVYDRVKDPSLGMNQKRKILEDEYGDVESTYESKVSQVKEKIVWARELFSF